jgi:quercetin dioxygenase-like cupin family protein
MNEQPVYKIYPEMIRQLPEADIPFHGIRGWLLQGHDHQVVFFDIEPIGEVAEHTHGPQWGIVIDGVMELTIAGETRTYQKGDHYFIPGGVVHSAVFKSRCWVVDFFGDKNRYPIKVD